MVFSSTIFLFIFLPLVLAIYYNPIIKSRAFKNVLLFLASLVFYAWGEPVFVFVMLLSIIITWLVGLYAHGSRLLTGIGITYHIALLFSFKYLSFISHEFSKLVFHKESDLNIALPIGISFFTFQMISYLVDVYRKKALPQKNPLYVGLYVALFPQLIAGPIVRYTQIEAEITSRNESLAELSLGMEQFIYGLGKKVLIANYMAQIADNYFDYLAPDLSILGAWLGAISYTLQIYFDFSGYSDMAIGLGRMFGFHFEQNFNYPYCATSVTDFWRRWHISLSSWFRDYVYIPLGGNRVSALRHIINLFIVWLLTGIWHGANWTFIAWGLLYFAVLIIEKNIAKFSTASARKKDNNLSTNQTSIPSKWWLTFLSHCYTLIIVVIAWVIFRATSISDALDYIGCMFCAGKNGFSNINFTDTLSNTFVLLIVALIGSTPILRNTLEKLANKGLGFIKNIWIMLVFILSLLQVIGSTYNPFIYFNF